ncbi:hypothetical protein LTR91_005173 [Friedmanniomyces endolithicus]|uniref:FAS1 domain-containing protein n=1 Tax=Friedmanniomyces endolithicus TaxID=329885 RepID=A0AAN6KUL1_9PEZI|nr:hypothetical protein LTR94_000215 [Friedmanniomyces endolithicus]KAK0797305.1 hypothetical protein LTR59_006857 [Friedmanniomyces endolithicus]KAK0805248.1 hypothetical protein LTR75_007384 [Friedmanniomyces endolithicus]KAK0815162.1 hypothetical protein LTR38_002456 [Friedmanniomyces endolithicus]KAK0830697.1 hypothetical protein LTR03_015759 [Friedmanniomyces endolithicus]
MRPYSLAAYLVTSAVILVPASAQLLPFFTKPSTARQPSLDQQPIMNANTPNPQPPPSSSSSSTTPPASAQAAVILSDVIGNSRQTNIFAGFTRDISSVATRLDASLLNTTVLAPANTAISALPRKPWEDPKDYAEMGAVAYEGLSGSDRASSNLRRFTEAHVVPVSPWEEGKKVKTLAGTELWWESRGGKTVVLPGEVEVEKVVSRVANGEVWMLKGALNYAV